MEGDLTADDLAELMSCIRVCDGELGTGNEDERQHHILLTKKLEKLLEDQYEE